MVQGLKELLGNSKSKYMMANIRVTHRSVPSETATPKYVCTLYIYIGIVAATGGLCPGYLNGSSPFLYLGFAAWLVLNR